MHSEPKASSIQKLLGYFLITSGFSFCIIIDKGVGSLCHQYGIDDQIVIPISAVLTWLKSELGYVRAGVSIDIDLGESVELPEEIDIPVYAEYEGDLLTEISIEIERWIPSEKILEEQEPIQTIHTETSLLRENRTQLSRKLIGYVTGTGGAILICDMDFIDMSAKNAYLLESQITMSSDEEGRGWRIGVQVHLPEYFLDINENPSELDIREIPVYGEYEGDSLKRISLEIDNPT